MNKFNGAILMQLLSFINALFGAHIRTHTHMHRHTRGHMVPGLTPSLLQNNSFIDETCLSRLQV